MSSPLPIYVNNYWLYIKRQKGIIYFKKTSFKHYPLA
jgi:hypothetical protein